MKRTRTIAAAPIRSASSTWDEIAALVGDALGASSNLDQDEVVDALATAAGVARALVAGGHLDHNPITLVAGPIHVAISTVSGEDALETDPPASVPGGSTVSDWTLYLPTPEPLTAAVREAANAHNRLSAEPAPEESAAESVSIDRDAIRRRVQESSS